MKVVMYGNMGRIRFSPLYTAVNIARMYCDRFHCPNICTPGALTQSSSDNFLVLCVPWSINKRTTNNKTKKSHSSLANRGCDDERWTLLLAVVLCVNNPCRSEMEIVIFIIARFVCILVVRSSAECEVCKKIRHALRTGYVFFL